MLYQTSDDGVNIRKTALNFSPSELSYDEKDTDTFVILDKVDTGRKVRLNYFIFPSLCSNLSYK